MPARIDVTPESGLLLVHDGAVAPPVVDRKNMAALERDALAGNMFFLASDDPVRFRVDLFAGETPPGELQQDFQPLGGSFLLNVPSGRLSVGGTAALALRPGPYLITLMGPRPFDGRRYEAAMIELVGAADYTFSKRTTWLSLLGCLPTILALGSLFFAMRRGEWRGFLFVALPLAVLAWVPHALLRLSPRYRRIHQQMDQHAAAQPQYILALTPTDRAAGLSGGFVNV